MFDNVIIAARNDSEGARDALWLARQLASAHGRLTIAYVQVVTTRPDESSGALSLAAERLPVLQELATLCEATHVDAGVLAVQAGSVADGLHELASRRDADVLVVGASHHDDYDRAFGHDNTRALLEGPPCPVAIAPRGYARRPRPLDRIAAGYDGSPGSLRALEAAREIARAHGASVSAFQAVPEPVRVDDPWNPEPEIQEQVAEVRGRIEQLGDVEAHAVSSEDAAAALARYGASVDLLVLGGHAYGPIDRLRSGSTAQLVADEAPCPLVVLPAARRRRVDRPGVRRGS